MLRHTLACAFFAFIFASSSNIVAGAETFSAPVIGVSDGDTITVLREGQRVRVRLANIDCPEKSQDFGARAKQFTSAKAFGKTVTVVSDGTDRYGRTTAEVILPEGMSLNKALVTEGYAWCYQRFCKDQAYLEYETEARQQKLGIWSQLEPVPPWAHRKAHGIGFGGAPKRNPFH